MIEFKSLFARYRRANNDVLERIDDIDDKLSNGLPITQELGRLAKARAWLRQVDMTLGAFIRNQRRKLAPKPGDAMLVPKHPSAFGRLVERVNSRFH